MTFKITTGIYLLVLVAISIGCESKHSEDTQQVSPDSLLTLPDGFYAYRNGSIYFTGSDNRYRIWYDLTFSGNLGEEFRIDDFANDVVNKSMTIKKCNISLSENRSNMKQFLQLSRKLKFRHISIDRSSKIAYSSKEELSEEYVYPLTDSTMQLYQSNKRFILLKNGWFKSTKLNDR